MEIETRKTCVYAHKIDGIIFYVGSGSGARAFTVRDRTELWWACVDRNAGRYTVEILAWFANTRLALAHELDEIARLCPEANVVGRRPTTREMSDRVRHFMRLLKCVKFAEYQATRNLDCEQADHLRLAREALDREFTAEEQAQYRRELIQFWPDIATSLGF